MRAFLTGLAAAAAGLLALGPAASVAHRAEAIAVPGDALGLVGIVASVGVVTPAVRRAAAAVSALPDLYPEDLAGVALSGGGGAVEVYVLHPDSAGMVAVREVVAAHPGTILVLRGHISLASARKALARVQAEADALGISWAGPEEHGDGLAVGLAIEHDLPLADRQARVAQLAGVPVVFSTAVPGDVA